MGRKYAALETIVLLVEQNHWLWYALPRAPPQAGPGRRVHFVDPLVTSNYAPTPHNTARQGWSGVPPLALRRLPVKVSAQAQRVAGCHALLLSGPSCIESVLGICNQEGSKKLDLGKLT